MRIGEALPGESRLLDDEMTGRPVRQLTAHPSQHHHCFFFVPSYTCDSRHRVFVSHRGGPPAVFLCAVETDALVRCTDRPDLSEWSVFPGRRSRFVLYVAGTTGYRLDLDTLEERVVAELDAVSMRDRGMVAGGMGTTALSHDDRWWALRINTADGPALVVVDLETGKTDTILRAPSIGHMQFCPEDPDLIYYGGDPRERIRLVRRDGSEDRLLYRQEPMQWVVHEVWLPGSRELAFVDWPHGVRAIDVYGGEERPLVDCNVWHASPSPDGRAMVADTNHPDIGLQWFPTDGSGETRTLCASKASSVGEHWKGPFPYSKGQVPVYAPQHTHPHPSFSPDGRRILFTSDRMGESQIYEIELDGA